MVGPEVINSTVGILEMISPILIDKLEPLITVLKVAGIAFAIYVFYLLVMAVWRWRDRKRLKRVEKKVDVIDKKLTKLLESMFKEKKKKKKK